MKKNEQDMGETYPACEIKAGHAPVAVVSPEIADAFGMRGLPNVIVRERAPRSWEYRAGASPHYQGQIYDENGKTVAITYDDENGKNAALIASGPEMLEALKQLVNALEIYHAERKEGEGLAFPMMRRARMAITKAEGRDR
jgi:hypothetical protein